MLRTLGLLITLALSGTALASPPEGAIRSFGSNWLRHEASRLFFDVKPGRLFSAQVREGLYAWDLEARERAVLRTPDAPVWATAISPDGERLYTTHEDHTLRVHDATTLEEVKRFGPFGEDLLQTLVISPDGAQVLLISDHDEETGEWRRSKRMGRVPVRRTTTTARLVDANTGEVRHTLTFPDARISLAAFSTDSAKLYLIDGASLRVHLVGSGELDAELELALKFRDFAPHPTRAIAAAAGYETVHLIDLETGDSLHVLEGLKQITSLAFSPGGEHLIAADFKGALQVWETSSATLLRKTTVDKGINTIAHAPEKAELAISTHDDLIRRWDYLDEDATPETPGGFGHLGVVGALHFSPDGGTLLAVSRFDDKRVLHWNVSDGSLARADTLEDHPWPHHFAPDGALISLQIFDGELRRYDPSGSGYEELFRVKVSKGRLPHGPPVTKIEDASFARDHSAVAFLTADEVVDLRAWPSGQELGRFKSETAGKPTGLALSADGGRLVISGYKASLDLYDIRDGSHRNIPVERGFANNLVFSPNGALLLMEHTLINLQNPEDQRVLEPMGTLFTVAFSPDSARVALGGVDGAIRVYDTASATLLATLNGHDQDISALAFSPDGEVFASGAQDGSIVLWETP